MIIFITISIKSKKWRDDCAFYFSLNINNSLDIMLLFEETQILNFNARRISSETNNKSSSNLCLMLYGWEVQAWEMAKVLKKRQSSFACASWLRAYIYLSTSCPMHMRKDVYLNIYMYSNIWQLQNEIAIPNLIEIKIFNVIHPFRKTYSLVALSLSMCIYSLYSSICYIILL